MSDRVTINTPDVDSNRELVELPRDMVDASMQIASGCATFADAEGSKFIVTGRGGLPDSPDEPLSSDVVWPDTRLPATTAQQHPSDTATAKPPFKPDAVAMAIVPATGWVFNNKGEVTLISHAPMPLWGLGLLPALNNETW